MSAGTYIIPQHGEHLAGIVAVGTCCLQCHPPLFGLSRVMLKASPIQQYAYSLREGKCPSAKILCSSAKQSVDAALAMVCKYVEALHCACVRACARVCVCVP